jgi:hypothetical protein
MTKTQVEVIETIGDLMSLIESMRNAETRATVSGTPALERQEDIDDGLDSHR